MMVLREAVSVSEDVMQDIQTLYTLQEVGGFKQIWKMNVHLILKFFMQKNR